MSADAATRLARARATQTSWAQLPPIQRAHLLRPLRHAIIERMDDIIEGLSTETGKPPMDSLAGDIMVTVEQLRFYERHAGKALRAKHIGKPWPFFSGTRFEEILEPHGVVLICAPWNYPLQLSVVPMATALFAGNAVLLKCSEQTPRTAQLITELCAAANLPQDLVQVSCEQPAAAEALIAAGPDLIFFTGSNRNGRIVAAQAAKLMIPTVMELGGKDAALVFDSCDLPRTVNGIVFGSFSNAGQVCVGTKRLYVQQPIYADFLRLFTERTSQLRTGSSIDSDIGPIRIKAIPSRLRAQVEDAIKRGAKLHTPLNDGTSPIILTEVPDDAPLLLEESFGPVVCIAPFTTEADAIAAANASVFALSASIWTSDAAQGQRVALALDSGSCAINDVIRNIGNPYATFGGNKSSGFGRYHGAEGLRTFSRIKSIMTSTRPRLTEIHWFPFQTSTFARLRTVLQLRHARSILDKLKSLTRLWMLLPFLLCRISLAGSPQEPNNSAPLIVETTLPPHAHGQIAYLIFASADGFPERKDKALRHDFVPVDPSQPTTQRIDLGPLPPGRYAVSLYLDENGNHKLDTNWLGLPKEAVGVSNNPRNRIGPPHFEDAVFVHGPSPQTIPITLVYCCKP